MATSIEWSIGKEGTTATCLDRPPFKAFFCFLVDGKLVETLDFDKHELSIEIERRRNAGEEIEPFEKALRSSLW